MWDFMAEMVDSMGFWNHPTLSEFSWDSLQQNVKTVRKPRTESEISRTKKVYQPRVKLWDVTNHQYKQFFMGFNYN